MKKSNKKARYSVVLPVYNEEKNIPIIVEKYEIINEFCPIEIIFVEDGSSNDKTREILKKIEIKKSFVKALFTTEKGYGISIFNGLKSCSSDYVSWTHADLQTDPIDTYKAFKIISKYNGEVYVKGLRKGRPFFDSLFTFGMSFFETILFRTKLIDVNGQPNMFDKLFLKKLDNPPKDFAFDLYCYYVAKRSKYIIKRFPVSFRSRIHGFSKWNINKFSKIKFILRVIRYSLKLKRMKFKKT